MRPRIHESDQKRYPKATCRSIAESTKRFDEFDRDVCQAHSGLRRARPTERVEPLGPVLTRSEAAAAARVLSGGSSLRRERACWNRHNAAGFQQLEPDFGAEKRIGGPDGRQLEPTD